MAMLKDVIEEICNENGWLFRYARRDYANLEGKGQDEDEDSRELEPIEPTYYLFLDVVVDDIKSEDDGVDMEVTHEGSLMLVTPSNYDGGSYEERYNKYIKPIREGVFSNTGIKEQEALIDVLKDSLRCKLECHFDKWRLTDLINFLDFNMDGMLCTFAINEEL